MTTVSLLRGHRIHFESGRWVYSDTSEPTEKMHKKRPCGQCGEYATEDGHDACIGTLQGVMNACCGHGLIEEAYVQFWNRTTIHGYDAINYFRENGIDLKRLAGFNG